MKNKRYIVIVISVLFLLLIPLIAMQFTRNVYWTWVDFLVAAGFLLSTVLTIDVIIRSIKKLSYRVMLIVVVIAIFIILWTELSVGIFETSIDGD